jgi:hypothetical protein
MFWAWKDTILSHYSILSGKGLMNEKHMFSDNVSLNHSKLFLCPLQPCKRPTAKKFGAIERRRLRPFVLRFWLYQEAAKYSALAHILRVGIRVGIIGAAQLVCQINQWEMGC